MNYDDDNQLEETRQRLAKNALPIDAWQTLVPDGRLDGLTKRISTTIRASAAPVPVEDQTKVKSANDDTFVSATNASINMMRMTAIPETHIDEPVSQINKTMETEKSRRKRDSKRDRRVKIEPASVTKRARPSPTVSVSSVPQVEQLPVQKMEQYNNRSDQVQLFEMNIRRLSGPNSQTHDVIPQKPTKQQTLAYCAQFKEALPWIVAMPNAIANLNGLAEYPDTPILSRVYLNDFMRACDPSRPYERPCLNLDREPHPHEGAHRCIAHKLSERQLGQTKAFRLRELIVSESAQAKMAAAMEQKQDPRIYLDVLPELCVLCHLWTTLSDCIQQRDKSNERAGILGSNQIYILNRFMVYIDQPGEYRREVMLAGDKINAGIWGPFPLFNEGNYIVKANGKIEESDNLLFRLARESSIQSTHSGAPAPKSSCQ